MGQEKTQPSVENHNRNSITLLHLSLALSFAHLPGCILSPRLWTAVFTAWSAIPHPQDPSAPMSSRYNFSMLKSLVWVQIPPFSLTRGGVNYQWRWTVPEETPHQCTLKAFIPLMVPSSFPSSFFGRIWENPTNVTKPLWLVIIDNPE